MSALTQAATQNQHHAGLPCSLATIRDELDPDSRADFDTWMDGTSRLSNFDMWRGLQALGFRVGKQTCGRHRRRLCRCYA